MFVDSFSQSLKANPSSAYEKSIRHGLQICFPSHRSKNTAGGFCSRIRREGMKWRGIATSTILTKFEFPFLWHKNPTIPAACNARKKLWSAFGVSQTVPLSVGARTPVPGRVSSKASLS